MVNRRLNGGVEEGVEEEEKIWLNDDKARVSACASRVQIWMPGKGGFCLPVLIVG